MRLIIATDEIETDEETVNYVDAEAFARIWFIVMESKSQIRAAELLRAPAEAGGESCMCEKPLDDDGWRCIRCGKLLAPRLGG